MCMGVDGCWVDEDFWIHRYSMFVRGYSAAADMTQGNMDARWKSSYVWGKVGEGSSMSSIEFMVWSE